jgi:hypothetical protein
LQNSIEKKKNSSLLGENLISYNLSEDNISLEKRMLYQGGTDCFVISSEGYGMEFRGENSSRSDELRKGTEKPPNEGSQNGQNGGPITRRKENQMMQLNSKVNNERTAQLNTLKKFDDFYKEKRNVENELYFYHAPRVSQDLFQVRLQSIDTNNFNRKNNYVEKFPVGKNE